MRLLKALLLTLALAAPMLAPLPMAQATVNEVSAANRYTGNGSTTVFSYTFKILTKNDIEVLVDDTVKTVDSHYTVSGLGASGGGSVTFLTAPLSNAKVTLLRKQAAAQASVYTPNEPFPSTRVEKDFDKLVMQVQQVKELQLRGLHFKKKSTTTGVLVDDLSATKYARVNGAGTGIEWVALTATGTYADPITTRGDLVVGNASGDPSRLGLGAKGYILGSDGTDAAWQSVGTNGTLLEADSTQTNGLLWNTRAAIFFKTLTTKGDLLTSTGATAQRKAAGANGTGLRFDSAQSDGIAYGAPAGYIFGLAMSNNVSDATNDIDIAVGEAASTHATYTSRAIMALTASLTKRLDATWAAGTNQGGRSSSLSISNTTWHVCLIRVAGADDVGFDTSATCANLITDHSATHARRIGSILREAGAIVAFKQEADLFYRSAVADILVTNPGTSAVTRTLSVPIGIVVTVLLNVQAVGESGVSNGSVYISSLDTADLVVTNFSAGPLGTVGDISSNGARPFGLVIVKTNTSGQIRSRNLASSTNTGLGIATLGWFDTRGRDN